MKYVLVLANKNDIHADSVVYHLLKNKVSVTRISIDELFRKSNFNYDFRNNCYIEISTKKELKKIYTNEIKSIYCRNFNFPELDNQKSINEHLIYFEKKSFINGFFRTLENITWINKPWIEEIYDNKIYQLYSAIDHGLQIPKTLITNNTDEFNFFYKKNRETIIKQLSEISLIDDKEIVSKKRNAKVYGFFTRLVKNKDLKNVNDIKNCPCLFQNKIEKKADIRVTVIGNKIFSTLIMSQEYKESKIDFRLRDDLKMAEFQLPTIIKRKLLNMLKSWGIIFAACDFIIDNKNNILFLEANVNGNWLWIEKKLKTKISYEIYKYLINNRN